MMGRQEAMLVFLKTLASIPPLHSVVLLHATSKYNYMYIPPSLFSSPSLPPSFPPILQEGKRRQFLELTQLMRELLDRRRQILSKTIPRVSGGMREGCEQSMRSCEGF